MNKNHKKGKQPEIIKREIQESFTAPRIKQSDIQAELERDKATIEANDWWDFNHGFFAKFGYPDFLVENVELVYN